MKHKINPSESALDSLYKGYIKFNETADSVEPLERELEELIASIDVESAKKKELEDRLNKLNSTSTDKLSNKISELRRKIDDIKAKADEYASSVRASSNDQKLSEIAETNRKMEMEKQSYNSKSPEITEMTTYESTALNFATREKKAIAEADSGLQLANEDLEVIERDYKINVDDCMNTISSIKAEYVDDIKHYESVIEDINSKWYPDINAKEQKLQNIRDDLAQQEADIEAEKNSVVKLSSGRYADLQAEYRRVDKDFKRQIKEAEKAGKATTRLNNSRNSQLNKLTAEMQKIDDSVEKDAAKFRAKIDAIRTKASKQIATAETELNRLVAKRDNELLKPQESLNMIISERDSRISEVNNEISRLNSKHSKDTADIATRKNGIESTRNTKLSDIEAEARRFVMSGDNCYSEVMEEVYEPFRSLEHKIEKATAYREELEKNVGAKKLNHYYNIRRDELHGSNYSTLERRARTFKVAEFEKPPVLTNIKMVAGVFVLIGIVLALGLIFGLDKSPAVGVVIGLVVVAVGVVIANKLPTAVIKDCVDFLILANEYTEMRGIKEYCTNKTSDKEYDKIMSIGRNLLATKTGLEEIESRYNDIIDNINKKYKSQSEADIKAIKDKEALEVSEIKKEIDKISADKRKKDTNLSVDKSTTEMQLKDTEHNIKCAIERKEVIEESLSNGKKSMTDFNAEYSRVMQSINSMAPSLLSTKGILSDSIYIIPDDDKKLDKHSHKPITKVEHNIKPFVLLYDTYGADRSKNSFNEEIAKITDSVLLDLLLAFRRVNSEDIYEQHIIDTVNNGASFMRYDKKKALKIGSVVRNQSDLRDRLKAIDQNRIRMYEHGDTIESINSKNVEGGNKPMLYSIVYFVIKPNSSENLSDTLRDLIPSCSDFGFIPVFICSKSDWDKESEYDRGICSEISKVTNTVVIYDGVKYSNMEDKENG